MADSEAPPGKGTFAVVTLLKLLLLLLVALPQWMMLCQYLRNHLVYSLAAFFAGFVLLAIIHLVEVLKYKRPWNFIFILVCYELLVLGVSTFLSNWELLNTIIIIAVALLFAAVSICIAVLLLLVGYPNPTKIVVVGCMGFALTFCIESIEIFKRWIFLRDVEVAVFLASIVTVMVAHVLITDYNFELLSMDDSLLVAFVLFIYYMLFLVGCRVAAYCIQVNTGFYFPDIAKATTQTSISEEYTIESL